MLADGWPTHVVPVSQVEDARWGASSLNQDGATGAVSECLEDIHNT